MIQMNSIQTTSTMSRPQVGIERLPSSGRRLSNEPRESMNCKSCRKRKIKCNRLRPTCEACQVFQCPCIYDAIPKKRGPKTDVLEALLKRVDGLEKRLQDEKTHHSSDLQSNGQDSSGSAEENGGPLAQRLKINTASRDSNDADDSALFSPIPDSISSPMIAPEMLLDTYFARVHGKPYHILDETTTRQRLSSSQMPNCLLFALFAVSARYLIHPNGYQAAMSLSAEYALRARADIDIDEPSIDTLQALLLLALSSIADGKGKKAYMLLASGIGMAMALELHREVDQKIRTTPVERGMRRRLFWTCYLMDRFTSCGSKRPALISDKAILLRLPSWSPNPGALPIDGEFFQNGSNLQYHAGTGKKSQGSTGMLIDITRILGITNRYLAAGGVKGDSHFPWHSLSNLSKIRQDLDIWASGTQDVFSSIESLFGQTDSTVLVLSKLIYHLIHCLIYRPFLPIDLAELAGTGQHQSWQIEATNLCFLHANAIAELVELGKQSAAIEWPAFIGYCICTAGTVHVHGAHYKGGPGEVFSASADFLTREMQQLSKLRYTWASVQHQRDTLQVIYNCHSELVKSLACNPMRYSPVFHLEDFFDRYNTLGPNFDGAHISFANISINPMHDNSFMGHSLYMPRAGSEMHGVKRKASSKKRHDSTTAHMNGLDDMSSGAMLNDPNSHLALQQQQLHQAQQPLQSPALMSPPFTHPMHKPSIPNLNNAPFSPPYSYPSLSNPNDPTGSETFDLFALNQSQHNANPSQNAQTSSSSMNYTFEPPPNQAMTPSAMSNAGSAGTTGTAEEKDPFLSLLEQLAENEYSRGGPSELDFFLGGQNG